MAAASLAVRVSAQIDDLQKGFADVNKTLDGFKKDFNKTSTDVQKSVDGMSKGMTGFSTTAKTSKTTFDSIGKSLQDLGGSFGSIGTLIGKASGAFGTLATSLGPIGIAIAGVTVAVTGVIVAFNLLKSAATAAFDFVAGAVTNTKALGEQLFDLSNQTGVSVESLSALDFVAGQTGVSLETMSGALFKMSTELGKGSDKTTKALKDLGLSLTDLRKQAPEDAFAKILQNINKLPSASAQAAAGVAVFGKAFKDIAQLKGENLDELIAKAKELGLVMSTETAVASDLLGDKLDELGKQFDGVQRQIGGKLIPVALTFVELFAGIFSDALKIVTGSLKSTGDGFKTFVTVFGTGVAYLTRFFAFMVLDSASWAIRTVANFVIVGKAFLDLAEKTASVGKDLDRLFNFGRQQGLFEGLLTGIEAAKKGLDALATGVIKPAATIGAVAQDVERTGKAIAMDFGSIYEGVLNNISKAADEMRKKLDALRKGGGAGGEGDKALDDFAKSLEKLNAQIVLAQAAGTPLAVLVELFGKTAAEAAAKADAFGIKGAAAVHQVADAFRTAALAKTIEEISLAADKMLKQFAKPITTSFADKQKAILDAAGDAWVKLSQIVADARERMEAVGRSPLAQQLKDIEKARKAELDRIKDVGKANAEWAAQATRDTDTYYDFLERKARGTFDTLVDRMNDLGVFTKAQYKSMAAAAERDYKQMLASGLFTAEELAKAFQRMNELIVASGEKGQIDWETRFKGFKETIKNIGLDAGATVAQALADGIETGDWGAVEQEVMNAASVAFGAGVAAAVDVAAPGFGRVAQPLAESFFQAWQREMGIGRAGRRMIEAFAETQGGFERMHQRLQTLGVQGEEIWIRMTQKIANANTQAAAAVVAEVEAMFARVDAGMKKFADGALKRIKAFSAAFKTATGESLVELKKLVDAEMPELEMGVAEIDARKALDGFLNVLGGGRAEVQEEFQRLGLYAGTAFADTLRTQGLAAALEVARPMFDELNTLGQQFGFTLEGAAGQFADFFRVASENEDVVSALEGITLMIQGAHDTLFITQELFSAFGQDAVTQFTRLTERGVAANQVMALMQPTLQALWEAQDRFGFETDAATQALIDQGVQQGIVGANMRDVNEKILDVLLAIAKVFKADIPAGLDATAQKSKQTADSVGRDFDAAGKRAKAALDIKVPDIDVRVNYHTGDVERPNFDGVPALAKGGIVRSPTLALVGEAGPELVIPLSQLGSVGPQGAATVILEVDGRALGEVVIPHLAAGVTRLGLGF